MPWTMFNQKEKEKKENIMKRMEKRDGHWAPLSRQRGLWGHGLGHEKKEELDILGKQKVF